MTPREFLESIVEPNVHDFHTNCGSLRYAHNAISAVDALAAHLYVWAKVNAPAVVTGIHDDSAYRASLAARNTDFSLLRDVAKAQKHVQLTRYNPQVAHSDQISAREIGFGEGGFGEGRFGGPEQVVVEIPPDDLFYIESTVGNSLTFLKSEMMILGL